MPQNPRNDLRRSRELIPHLIKEFLLWMKVRNYSKRTLESREIYLRLFSSWCSDRGIERVGEITKASLEQYRRYVFHRRRRDGRPLTISSQTAIIESVRMFCRWLARKDHLPFDPASGLELPKQEKRLPRNILSISEVERVMQQPDIEKPMGLRDRAILEVFYSTAIRRAELANLDVFDLDAGRGILVVRLGKGGKDRLVPIGERAIAWVEKYLLEARPLWLPSENDGPLFVGVIGNRFNIGYLSALVKKHIDKAEIGKTGSCHLLRHAAGTHMLEGGADIRYIQQMLGHAYLSSTQIYTHISIAKLKEVHERTHPGKSKKHSSQQP